MTQTVRGDTDPAASEPFRQWQYAAAALKAAEARGASHAEIVQLSAAVIRTRNALTLDRVYAGWEAPDDILKHLTADEQLLHENDDTARA
ncbi:MAG TPA: hypothetical protein VGL75_17790 [Acidothermaceae bacterium]|jgi:hypothetical protein